MTFPKVGNLASAFSLSNQNGDQVSLKDFRSKSNVVLYFYPKAMTPDCTTQACGISETSREFAKLDTIVLGVSPDPQSKLQEFTEKYQLNFDLLADEDHKVATQYGCWGLQKVMGREFTGMLRTTFVIDKQGHLCHVIDKVETSTHHYDVLTWVREHLA